MAKQRDISDFFKPYARTTIPAKRPSPSPDVSPIPSKRQSPTPEAEYLRRQHGGTSSTVPPRTFKTPSTTRRFRDAESDLHKSPVPYNQRVTLALGSPRPRSTQKEQSFSSSLSTLEATPAVVRTASFDFPSIRSPTVANTQVNLGTPASSKKVVKGGKLIAVKDSDSDDDDSDSSLEDLEDLLGTKTRDTPSTSSSPPDAGLDHFADFTVKLPRLQDRTAILGKRVVNATKTTTSKHKFSLDNILARHIDDKGTEQTVAKTREGYRDQKVTQNLEGNEDSDKNLLAAIAFEQDEDGAKGATRLMGAVERTEAINEEMTWSFFRPGMPQRGTDQSPHFLEDGIRSSFLNSILRDKHSRQRAFLSGYVAEEFSNVRSMAATKYLFQSIISEPREDLCNSYTTALHCMPKNFLDVSGGTIDDVFLALGAREEAVYPESIQPSKRLEPALHTDLHPLICLLKALASLAEHLSTSGATRLTEILWRLMIDESLMSSPTLSTLIQDCFLRIFDVQHIRVAEQLCDQVHATITKTLTDPLLQSRLLSHMPVTSSCLSTLRLQLAQTFLLSSTAAEPIFRPPELTLSTLNTHLTTSPIFTTVNTAVDLTVYSFPTLVAHLTFLDILLTSPAISRSLRLSDPKTFNTQVDAIADRLNAIFSNITDTGASHMTRTEAKEKIEALVMKLRFVVRTKPRAIKRIWHGGGDDEEESRAVMRNFLIKRDSKPMTQSQMQTKQQEPDHPNAGSDSSPPPPGDTGLFPSSDASFSSTEAAIRDQLGLGV